MRLALMGAGALGTIVGAHIARGGLDIVLIDAYQEHVDVLNEKGATVTGTRNFNVQVKAITPDKMEGLYDIVFYLAKQTFNDIALNQVKEHLAPNGVVVTFQNGVPEPAVAKVVGDDRVIGAPVGWGATFKGPGVAELTTEEKGLHFDLGEYKGGVTERLNTVKAILELMCPVTIQDNLMGIRWAKLFINSTASGMSTVMNKTFGDVIDNKTSMKCITHIGNECMQVADAAGIKVEHFGTFDLNQFRFTNKEDFKAVAENYMALFEPHRKLVASMLQDLRNGKTKTEVDAINGVVCSFGKKYGVETPLNDQVVALIKKKENRDIPVEACPIEAFTFPEVK
ncbi:MAG: ketopantoate reductase family protein [Peptostreptococcaceae bacterium]|nr:ketopantoate reductase family protein [Peptostreptococcaceae bacterium]